MSVFFTSDCHFYHKKIINFCNRPYKDIDEMNYKLIENWNNIVSNNDDIYCLGDFALNSSQPDIKNILTQLNGNKYLICGNHDKFYEHIELDIWKSVEYYKKLNINNIKVILCHYPIFDFESAYKKSIHLFGHIHNNNILDEIYNFHRNKNFKSYCVGVDFNNFTPIKFEDILNKINYESK